MMNARQLCSTLLAIAVAASPAIVAAQPTTSYVRIEKIFSTLDGAGQAVELRIVRVENTPLVLTDRVLTVRDRYGNTRAIRLDDPRNNAGYPFNQRNHILLSSFADDWGPYSDMVIPKAFLPIDGGTLSINGMDEVVYGRLPEDGRHALDRDGEVVPADFEFWGSYDVAETIVTEFHHAELDHYFMTNRADEIQLLRSGAIPGWEPTGEAFLAYARPRGEGLLPACRYLLLRSGGYSHFFSASAADCAALAGGEGNILETSSAFLAAVASNGACGILTIEYPNGYLAPVQLEPVYRLWNGKADANHRYVIDPRERDAMVARGWIPEGSGSQGIAMCAHSGPWLYPWFGSTHP